MEALENSPFFWKFNRIQIFQILNKPSIGYIRIKICEILKVFMITLVNKNISDPVDFGKNILISIRICDRWL